MATANEIWLPRSASEAKYAYLNKNIDRPGATTKMFRETYNKTWSGTIRDFYSGNVTFSNTISSGDSHTDNLDKIWSKDDGNFCNVGAKVKIDNWQPIHIGSINEIHTASDAKSAVHSPLFGYTGIRFEYRWSTGNYWSNCPSSIPYGMMHFLNVANNVFSSYEIICDRCSPNNTDFWIDRFASNDSRKSDNWKGAYYKLKQSGAADQIRRSQLSLVGVSFQIKQHSRGGASHTRAINIQNLTPIFDDNRPYKPLLMKPKANPYNRSSASNGIPFEIYRRG